MQSQTIMIGRNEHLAYSTETLYINHWTGTKYIVHTCELKVVVFPLTSLHSVDRWEKMIFWTNIVIIISILYILVVSESADSNCGEYFIFIHKLIKKTKKKVIGQRSKLRRKDQSLFLYSLWMIGGGFKSFCMNFKAIIFVLFQLAVELHWLRWKVMNKKRLTLKIIHGWLEWRKFI